MRDTARDPAPLDPVDPLELLRVQRSRLADRMRPPWWYLPGAAIVWALFFAGPFSSRSFSSPSSVSTWAIVVPIAALCLLMQWGMTRATGIKTGLRPLRVLQDGLFYRRPGRPASIAMALVCFAGLGTEGSLIRHGLLAAAIAVAALAVAAEMAAQQALLRAIRQDLRGGGGTA
jgi:amino acid transporter